MFMVKTERNTPHWFWPFVLIGDRCWEWQGARDRDGYGACQLGLRKWQAHRLAWVLARGAIRNGLHVLHHCDNPPCVRVAHLFLGTNADNVADKMAKERHRCGHRGAGVVRRGEEHPRALLTTDIVRRIVTHRHEGRSLAEIALELRINPASVWNVLSGRCWSHVTGLPRRSTNLKAEVIS